MWDAFIDATVVKARLLVTARQGGMQVAVELAHAGLEGMGWLKRHLAVGRWSPRFTDGTIEVKSGASREGRHTGPKFRQVAPLKTRKPSTEVVG